MERLTKVSFLLLLILLSHMREARDNVALRIHCDDNIYYGKGHGFHSPIWDAAPFPGFGNAGVWNSSMNIFTTSLANITYDGAKIKPFRH